MSLCECECLQPTASLSLREYTSKNRGCQSLSQSVSQSSRRALACLPLSLCADVCRPLLIVFAIRARGQRRQATELCYSVCLRQACLNQAESLTDTDTGSALGMQDGCVPKKSAQTQRQVGAMRRRRSQPLSCVMGGVATTVNHECYTAPIVLINSAILICPGIVCTEDAGQPQIWQAGSNVHSGQRQLSLKMAIGISPDKSSAGRPKRHRASGLSLFDTLSVLPGSIHTLQTAPSARSAWPLATPWKNEVKNFGEGFLCGPRVRLEQSGSRRDGIPLSDGVWTL